MSKQAVLVLAACLSAAVPTVHAQAFPAKPITIVVPFPPGAIADAMMRLFGQKVADSVGQQVLVENRPGAGGSVGAAYVKNAPPDGYTLLQANTGSHAINPALPSKPPYDPVKDFQPIMLLSSFPSFLVVPATSPAKSVAELVAYSKSKPGGLSFGSAGIATNGHLLGEMLKAKAGGVPMEHVAYKGAAPAIADLLSGRIDFVYFSYASVTAQIKDGKLRALAVGAPARHKAVPDIPTMAEAGYPGVELNYWFGLVAPAGTPAPVVRKLNEEFVKAAKDPSMLQRLTDMGLDVAPNTPQQFAKVIAEDGETLGKIVKSLNLKAE